MLIASIHLCLDKIVKQVLYITDKFWQLTKLLHFAQELLVLFIIYIVCVYWTDNNINISLRVICAWLVTVVLLRAVIGLSSELYILNFYFRNFHTSFTDVMLSPHFQFSVTVNVMPNSCCCIILNWRPMLKVITCICERELLQCMWSPFPMSSTKCSQLYVCLFESRLRVRYMGCSKLQLIYRSINVL